MMPSPKQSSIQALDKYVRISAEIPGWTRGAEALALAASALSLPANAIVVEVGTFLGSGAILLAGARKLAGSGQVHCVDPFDASGDEYSTPFYREIVDSLSGSLRETCEANIRRADLGEWITLHQGRGIDVARSWSDSVDLLFMDGDQSYSEVAKTYEAWLPLLRRGGVLALHNSSDTTPGHDGPRLLVQERVRSPHYSSIRLVDSTTFAEKR
jgi:predicted O-methyltransferase YrrM